MTTTEPGQSDPTAEQLRDAMVRSLIELDAARDPRVIAAFRAVPRHLATPDLDLARAYDAEFAAVTKTDATGVDISSVSAPRVQAMQIEQAQIQPGMTVLEVGSGGPNAAYLAEMVGAEGHVVTMDIDPDVTARATGFLQAAGYPDVTVPTIRVYVPTKTAPAIHACQSAIPAPVPEAVDNAGHQLLSAESVLLSSPTRFPGTPAANVHDGVRPPTGSARRGRPPTN